MTHLQQELINTGYKKNIASCGNHLFHSTNVAFYKWVYHHDGWSKGYQLLCYWYDNRELLERHSQVMCEQESLQWDVQFNLGDGKVFDVTYCTNNISEAEAFFAKMFKQMECTDYDQ